MSAYVRSEIGLDTVMRGPNRVVTDAYETSCAAKIAKSSMDVPCWDRN